MRIPFVAALMVGALTFSGGLQRVNSQSPPLKIGWISIYSGPLSDEGKIQDSALAAYLAAHGDTVAGRKVVFVKRDEGAPNPETARRLAQELVVGDQVDILAGGNFTPDAIAIGQVAAQSKKPFLIMNATGPGVLDNAPNSTRWSYSGISFSPPLADWALKNGFSRIFVITLDYSPGLQAAEAFEKAFSAGGGTVLGEVRAPLNTQDFSPYLLRARDAKPQAIFAYVGPGGYGPVFLKQFTDLGFRKDHVALLTYGDFLSEPQMPGLADSAVGVISVGNYSSVHDSALNRQFVKSAQSFNNGQRPDFTGVAAYDIMNAIYKVVDAQKGNVDLDKTIDLLRGMKFESPRGPITIDPATRDIVQNIYIRRSEKHGDEYVNTEIATYPAVASSK